MAKPKAEETKLEETKTEQSLAGVPQYLLDHAGQGVEGIVHPEDIRPPRILIAQSGSPQVKKGDPKRIEGLEEGHIFNDLTQENYKEGPLKIVVFRMLGSRFIEFAPLDEGGGIIDDNVPYDDPRTKFTEDDKGESIKPVATKFLDYLIWLPEQKEFAAFSLKNTQLKVGVQLNSLLKLPLKLPNGSVLPNPPSWARQFKLFGVMEKNDQYTWANYKISNDGMTSEEDCLICAKLYKQFEGKNVKIEREPGSDDGTQFPTDM